MSREWLALLVLVVVALACGIATTVGCFVRYYRTPPATVAGLLGAVDVATSVPVNWGVLPTTLDGRPLATGDRILVKDEPDGRKNGIYVVAPPQWTRAPDLQEAFQVVEGTTLYVRFGLQHSGSTWVLRTLHARPQKPGRAYLYFLPLLYHWLNTERPPTSAVFQQRTVAPARRLHLYATTTPTLPDPPEWEVHRWSAQQLRDWVEQQCPKWHPLHQRLPEAGQLLLGQVLVLRHWGGLWHHVDEGGPLDRLDVPHAATLWASAPITATEGQFIESMGLRPTARSILPRINPHHMAFEARHPLLRWMLHHLEHLPELPGKRRDASWSRWRQQYHQDLCFGGEAWAAVYERYHADCPAVHIVDANSPSSTL